MHHQMAYHHYSNRNIYNLDHPANNPRTGWQ